LNYLTAKELESKTLDIGLATHHNFAVRGINSALNFIGKTATKFTDKYLPSGEYYNYQEPKQKTETVSEVIDRIYEQNQNVDFAEEIIEQRLIVGGDMNIARNIKNIATDTSGAINNNSRISALKTNQSAKTRFYSNVDFSRNKLQKTANLKVGWDRDTEILKKEISFKAENLASNLLGLPNKRLSNGKELRFGEHGSIAVRIAGNKAGTWYDFSSDKGGDMFDLVQEHKGCDFKGAADYLRQAVGMEVGNNINHNHLQLVRDHANSNITERYIKDKQKEETEAKAKQIKVNKLYDSAKPIENDSIAHRYLRDTRAIKCALSPDLKTTKIYDKEQKSHHTVLIAFARDITGKITGGQQIILDETTNNKAAIDVPKKSFGKISGSFVDLGTASNNKAHKHNKSNIHDNLELHNNISHTNSAIKHNDQASKVTIIAEGLETALSVKQALHSDPNNHDKQIKFLCSLGISNIKNYQPNLGEKIIIGADNDGLTAIPNKTIDEAKIVLQNKGAFVEIVRPEKVGDFNDMLKDKDQGEGAIQRTFSSSLTKHTATSLNQYLSACNKTADITTANIELSVQEKESLAYIQKYALSEQSIIDAYRKNGAIGAIELDQTRKSLEFAANCYKQNKEILLEAKKFGYEASEVDSTKSLLNMDETKANSFCKEIRDNHLDKYLNIRLRDFNEQKKSSRELEKLKPIVVAEQKFLKETYESLKSPINERSGNMLGILRIGEIASKQPKTLDKIFSLADKLITKHDQSEIAVCQDLSHSTNINHIYTKLDKETEFHQTNSLINQLNTQKSAATTPYEAIEALDSKQKFFATLEQSLKYQDNQDHLKEYIQTAKVFQSEKITEKLQKAVKLSLELGLYSADFLLKELKTTGNSRNSYRKLDERLEVFHINKTLNALDKTTQQSPKPQNTIKALGARDKFLAGLQDNLKYPEIHDSTLIKSIQNAYSNKQNDVLQHLHKITTLYINQVSTKAPEINKILQSSQNTNSAFNSITKSYHSHVLNEIQKSLNVIDSGKRVTMDKKNFNCPVKFLDHVVQTRTHEYFPRVAVQKIQSKVIERQKQLILSKDMGGLCL
jgi:hypothetical protein